MKAATAVTILLGIPLAILAVVASTHFQGPGERALATAIDQLPIPTATEPPTAFTPAIPEACVLPPLDNPPKVTIGRVGRDGQLVDCALRAFKELFPGCGDPATNPEDFSLELFKAWLASNGYKVDDLPDTNNDGIPDPIVHFNQVLVGYWKGGLWSE